MAFNGKNVINGTHGAVYLDGEEISEVKTFQAKLEISKEEIKMVGQMATDSKMTGYKGTGSMSLHKVNSRMIKKIAHLIKQGVEPRFTLIGKLADPDALGRERVALYNVSFDDLTLMDWEAGAVGQSEHPFTFVTYDVLDSI